MATNKFVRVLKTRRFAEDDEVQTELTLDCSDLTARDFQEYALMSLAIKWQGQARRNATRKDNPIPIPVKAEWKVPKPGVRTQLTIDQMVMALSFGAKAELLAKLMSAMQDTDADMDEVNN